jgi:hypothetical protein
MKRDSVAMRQEGEVAGRCLTENYFLVIHLRQIGACENEMVSGLKLQGCRASGNNPCRARAFERGSCKTLDMAISLRVSSWRLDPPLLGKQPQRLSAFSPPRDRNTPSCDRGCTRGSSPTRIWNGERIAHPLISSLAPILEISTAIKCIVTYKELIKLFDPLSDGDLGGVAPG